MSTNEAAPTVVLDDMLERSKSHFLNLLGVLKPAIVDNTYDSILGEDVSGRIPALVIAGVIRRYARDTDKPEPSLAFYAGGSMGEPSAHFIEELKAVIASREKLSTEQLKILEQDVQNAADQIRNDNLADYFEWSRVISGNRTLVVTDQLTTGRSMYEACIALQNVGIKFDIATLATQTRLSDYGEMYLREVPGFNSTIMSGASKDIGLLYSSGRKFGSPVLRRTIGVEKDWIMPFSKKAEDYDANLVNEARKRIGTYADDLYARVF